MNAESAQSLVESVMRDRAVLLVQVVGQADTEFMRLQAPQRPVGNVYRAERDIAVRGERIGHVVVEMDDARSQQELREKQIAYVFVLGAQLAMSMALIVLFMNRRLLRPLRRLMRFSDRLSHGDFDTRLEAGGNDELGRLAAQLEQMRAAIGQLFEDVGQREERFRTIVTQVPGAVFRYRPDGPIDFVSDAIEDIAGYTAAQLMRGTTHCLGRPDLPGRAPHAPPRRQAGGRRDAAVCAGIPHRRRHRHRALGGRKWPAAGRPLRAWSGSTASLPTSASASTMKCASRRC